MKVNLVNFLKRFSDTPLPCWGNFESLIFLFLLQVTFSQVVDQMACSFSESSSLSDLSSCTEDFKHSVSSHVPSSRRGPRKLMRSNRLSKRAQRQQQQAGGYFGRTHPLGKDVFRYGWNTQFWPFPLMEDLITILKVLNQLNTLFICQSPGQNGIWGKFLAWCLSYVHCTYIPHKDLVWNLYMQLKFTHILHFDQVTEVWIRGL